MRTVDIIRKKRNGEELTKAELSHLIEGYCRGDIPDYQAAAWAMAVYFQGQTARETAVLTELMAHSGDTLDLSGIPGIKVDKHSTGGVGDKTTLKDITFDMKLKSSFEINYKEWIDDLYTSTKTHFFEWLQSNLNKELNLSEMSRILGISRYSLKNYKSKVNVPSVTNILKACDYFGTTASDLARYCGFENIESKTYLDILDSYRTGAVLIHEHN